MIKRANFIAFILALASPLFATPNELPPISFGGGVDYKNACTDIRDDRACDMSNMVNDINGASFKRNGSKRYIDQAVSSNPVTSLYRAYASSGTSIQRALLMTTWDSVYVSTTETVQNWVFISSGFIPNQHYSYVMMNGKAIFSAQESTEPARQYDILTSSYSQAVDYDGTSNGIRVRWKYAVNSRNYLIGANCADISAGTTFYPSRIYYSLLAQPSSMTALRFINIKTDDGEEITGIGEMFGRVHLFKPSSIHELNFSVLNLTANGGDQTLTPIVQGFGLLAPRTLASTGDYYIFLAKDGIRLWDGARRSRLNPSDESEIISGPIEPIIKSIIKNKTYNNCSGVYYPKKRQYVFNYEDTTKSPKGKANASIVFDFNTKEWFPFNGWQVECMATMDGQGDKGELLYGQSADGYVYYADSELNQNDARKEIVIDPMESTANWLRATQDIINVKEGDASMQITISTTVSQSSMTYMGLINVGEWYDRTKTSKNDKISFKVFTSSIQNITSLRLDLEINDIKGEFDSNFTSVTFSSSALTGGNTNWTTITVALSSFPILAAWTDLSIESFPFANTYTYYGIRFVSTGIGNAALSIDDLRLIQDTENPLNAFRLTKQYNFGTSQLKRFRQLILNAEKSDDSSFSIDFFNDFGEFSKREEITAGIGKELYATGLNGIEGVYKLSSVDFRVLGSTLPGDRSVFAPRPFTVDDKYIYTGDHYNNRILKIDKSSMTGVFVSTFGSVGTGTDQFHLIYQMAVDDMNLYVCDFGNHRIKVHRKKDLSYVRSYGTLGTNTTSFHNPTGVAVDENYVYAAQDGNYRIQKFGKSTGAYITSIDLNLNTIGDITLGVDEKYLYDAYDTVSPQSLDHQDVVLEKRNKSDLSLVDKITLRPDGVNTVAVSTYNLQGDIGISDDYIFISFTDDVNRNGNYYIQKRLKSDFSLVRERKTSTMQFAVGFKGVSSKTKQKNIIKDIETDGSYIQFKYSESGLDNSMKLFNQSILLPPVVTKER